MKNIFLSFCFVSLLSVGLLFSFTIYAAEPASITIQTQPMGAGSVDAPLTEQPVVLVKDEENNPISGITVTAFKASGSGKLKGTLTATSNSAGLAVFHNLQYTKTDAFTISFIYSGGSPITSDSVQLKPGKVSASNSSVSALAASAVADGNSSVNMKITAQDQYGNPIPDAGVKISLTGEGNNVSPFETTNDIGQTSCSVTSTVAEKKQISASINNIALSKGASIEFVPGKIAKLIISADTAITTDESSNIKITGQDQFGNIVTNDSSTSVALSVDNGGSLSSALLSMSNGVAESSLKKNDPGIVNLTASVGNITAASKIAFAKGRSETSSASANSNLWLPASQTNQTANTGQDNSQADISNYLPNVSGSSGNANRQQNSSLPQNNAGTTRSADNESVTQNDTGKINEDNGGILNAGQASIIGFLSDFGALKNWILSNFAIITLIAGAIFVFYLLWKLFHYGDHKKRR